MLRSGRRVSLIAMWLLLFPVYFLSSIFKLLWVSAPGSPRSSTRDKEATVFFYLTSQRASQFWKANFLQQTSQRCRLQGHWEQPRTTGRSVQSCPGCSHSHRGSGQQALHRVPAPSACPAHTTESCHFTSINELPHTLTASEKLCWEGLCLRAPLPLSFHWALFPSFPAAQRVLLLLTAKDPRF
jgi:hypothetical protein